jgi:hypothetical protein
MDGAKSDLDKLLRRVDFWCLCSGGAIAPAGFQETESRGHTITVLAQQRFIGSGAFVVHNGLSRCT